MEYENEHSNTRGIAIGGLTTGIIGAALGVLNGGGLGNVLGGCNRMGECAEDHLVNRYEASQSARIAELETEVKLRDANTYTDQKLLELYKYVDNKFGFVEHELCDQRTYNAVNTSVLNCVKGDVAALMALTKTIIPASNICPEPMPQYNSWVAPTATT